MQTRNAVARLLAEGNSVSAIAVKLGLAEPTVSYHVERLRSPPAPPRAPNVIAADTARYQLATRDHVAQLLGRGLSRLDVARSLGISKATVSYHARRLGLPIDPRCARRYDWEAIQRYYNEGHSVRQCLKAFGCAHQTWHSAKKRGAIVTRPAGTPGHELFVAGQYRSRENLKRRLLAENLKPACCALCGISEWRMQPLSLALHHINGDRMDNRLENLELLCPNCHSQTSTYSGRNGHRRRRGRRAEAETA
jgi:DNA-binding CsgD family transcriptional regulator